MSLDSPGVTDQGTFFGAVQPVARMSCMQRCSRLLQLSPDERATDHSDMSVCIDGEPSGHVENLKPGELLRDFNVFQQAQFTSGIQCDTEPPRLNKNVDPAKDSFNEILGSPDLIMKLHDCLRDEDELWFPCAELKDNHRCLLPEHDSGPTQLIQKESGDHVRRKFVFVKKSCSVNALIQDNSLEDISKNKLNKYHRYRAKEIMPRRLKVGYQNGDPKDDNTGKRFHSLRHEMMTTETDGESTEAHSDYVSSFLCCKEMENSPGEEIPGLKRYSFRRSTMQHSLKKETHFGKEDYTMNLANFYSTLELCRMLSIKNGHYRRGRCESCSLVIVQMLPFSLR
ncbi:uncharacterized protein LOC122029370 [Zingiber officinale]|uniref:uncharacterized protein LOC122029370 n=1 Tax=Zingiber officinale TaxID=94328 RepID=UPI001C4C8754|nr:uncharacterized protein LOC122029370 [Zingiber officinale]